MENSIHGVDPNVTNPNSPKEEQPPVDPSNTSNVGQRVEQGVIDIKDGISEQSSEWEDVQERGMVPRSVGVDEAGEKYLKDPSPEEMSAD